jgi:hypothetical protein
MRDALASAEHTLAILKSDTRRKNSISLIGECQEHINKWRDETSSKEADAPKKQAREWENFRTDWQKIAASAREEAALGYRFPIKASGTRRFILYTPEGYRSKFLATRIPINQIKAFPLPDPLVDDFLGDKVREHFYVVALTIQNDAEQDRLINTGIINAYGRAIIFPLKKDGGQQPFTIPVQVAPESLEQVYAIISDSKPYRTREWIFRGLDFAGELSTAIATGFKGSPDLIRALGVYTGVGIPSFQKFWPDPVPNYLRNIVSFGMPELVKVPQHGSVGYKLLFFSKDTLHSLISDPSLFTFTRKFWKLPPWDKTLDGPDQVVIYTSFDTIEVPFENVVAPAEGTVESRLRKVIQEANALNAFLDDLQPWLSDNQDAEFTDSRYMTKKRWSELNTALKTWHTTEDTFVSTNAAAKTVLTDILKNLGGVSDLLSKDSVSRIMVTPGKETVSVVKLEGNNMVSQILAGHTPETYIGSVEDLEGKIASAKATKDLLLRIERDLGHLAEMAGGVLNATDGASFTNSYNQLREALIPVVATASGVKDAKRISPGLKVPPTLEGSNPPPAPPAEGVVEPQQPTTNVPPARATSEIEKPKVTPVPVVQPNVGSNAPPASSTPAVSAPSTTTNAGEPK